MAIITPFILLLKNYKSVRQALTPGLVISTLLSLSFVAFRKFPPVCSRIPLHLQDGNACEFQWREAEMYMCLMCVVMIKNRTAVSLQEIVDRLLTYSKVVNTVLFFRVSPKFGFVYVLLCFIRLWVFPDMFPEQEDNILHIDDETLASVLKESPKTVWVMEFYTTWASTCHSVSPVFSSVANRFSSEYLKFGKVDLGRAPVAAKEYGINVTTMSRQLPTIIIFKNMQPVTWRPMAGSNGKIIKYSFTEDNITRDFRLQELYDESLKKSENESKKKKSD